MRKLDESEFSIIKEKKLNKFVKYRTLIDNFFTFSTLSRAISLELRIKPNANDIGSMA
jgi:hypothetical protein